MNKKIIIAIIVIVLMVITLWFGGFIPNDYLEKYKEFLDKRESLLNNYDTYTKSLLK